MATKREVELKFLIAGRRARIDSIPHVGKILAKTPPTRIETTYLDTPDEKLNDAGLTLRLRKTGGKTVLSLKAAGTGAIGREESEVEIEKSWPSLKDWGKVVNGTILNDAAIRDALAPVAKTVIDRAATDIQWEDSRIEVALDRGKAEAADRGDLPIREIELELLEGNTKDLFQLARELVAHPALKLSFRSKGDRAAALKKGILLEPRAATTPHLSPEHSVDKAFRRICEACLLDFMANCDAMPGPKPVEAVHRARIATRRLRSAFELFGDLLKRRRLDAIVSEIKWLAGLLGQVRDLDVLLEHIKQCDDVKGASVDLLTERLHQRHAEAFAALRDALESDRCRMFLFNFVAWLHGDKWRKSKKVVQVTGAKFLAGRVRKRLRRLFTLRGKLSTLPADDLHEIRKNAKSLRYMLEFQNALPRDVKEEERHRAQISAMEEIQKQLGKIQDSHSFRDLLKAQILGTDGKEVKRGLSRAVKDLASALKQKPRQPLGKAEAALESSDAAAAA